MLLVSSHLKPEFSGFFSGIFSILAKNFVVTIISKNTKITSRKKLCPATLYLQGFQSIEKITCILIGFLKVF